MGAIKEKALEHLIYNPTNLNVWLCHIQPDSPTNPQSILAQSLGFFMSRTRRIYNNPNLKKAARYNLDDGEIHICHGIPYTRRSWICMGNCPMCRDPKREPKLIRKQNKEQFRFQLKFGLY